MDSWHIRGSDVVGPCEALSGSARRLGTTAMADTARSLMHFYAYARQSAYRALGGRLVLSAVAMIDSTGYRSDMTVQTAAGWPLSAV
jgi:hypothetical protein